MDYVKRMENHFIEIIPSLEKIANNSMEQVESISSGFGKTISKK